MTVPPSRNQIKPGMKVSIELKQDQGTGKLTEGIVKEILTSDKFHPHGIKVELENGRIGRVKEIVDSISPTKLSSNSNSTELSIPKEEDLHYEFKSTFRFHLKRFENGDGKKVIDKEIEKEISITMCAFANASGGKLFIGVKDDRTVIGLDNDFEVLKNPNTDKFQRAVWQSIQNYLKDMTYISKIKISTPKINKKIICVIEAPPANEPIFVHDNNIQESYVRIGPKSEKFPPTEFIKYCNTRFK